MHLTAPAAKQDPGQWAASVGLPTKPWSPVGFPLPSAVTFLGDDEWLVAAVPPGAKRSAGDQALAYGIAHAGNRRLALLLPDHLTLAARLRATGLRDVEVFTINEHGDDGDRVTPTPTVSAEDRQIQAATAQLGSARLKLSEEQEAWLAPLNELAVYPYLVPAHRKAYRAWHCMGRQLINVRKADKGNALLVTAGVDYSHPTPDHPVAHHLTLSGLLTGEEFEEVKKAVYRGMIDRFAGTDQDQHLEHRMQAVMKGHPECFIPTPLSHIEREFPARRPNGRPAFLDFLYVDQNRRLHIVETKIGLDEMLVIQGLDYWLWANANLEQLSQHFDVGAISDIAIDYVVATKNDRPIAEDPQATLLSSYAPAQLRRLRDNVTRAVYRCQGWRSDHPELHELTRDGIEATHVKHTTMNVPRWGSRQPEVGALH